MKLRCMNLDLVGYYDTFPPRRMNVSTKTIEVAHSSGANVLKRILVADKDFTTGEVIYNVKCRLTASTISSWLTNVNRRSRSSRFWTQTWKEKVHIVLSVSARLTRELP